jgi:hypothetical protein
VRYELLNGGFEKNTIEVLGYSEIFDFLAIANHTLYP